MTGFVEVAVLLSAPLLLAAAGELLLERSGSLHIGIEGTMLIGAFVAFAAGLPTASVSASLGAAAAAGALCGLLFAAVTVARRADPILVGTVWNLFAYGLTAFLYRGIAGVTGDLLLVPHLGSGLGRTAALTFVFTLPVAVHLFLTRTRPGLLLSAAGENPEALRALGSSVALARGAAAVASGTLAGLAGGLLMVTISPTFVEGVTAGRGFLALALVVFSRWRPLRLIAGSLLLGGATAFQYRLQAGGKSDLPYALFLALPGLLALVAVAFSRSGRDAPKALGQPAP